MGGGHSCHCIDEFDSTSINFSSGCRRITVLKCGKQSHVVTLPRMKVPNKFLHTINRIFEECMAECSNNCSCMAYAYTNSGINIIMADKLRCLIWIGELVDSGKYTNDGENLYLRLADSPSMHNRLLALYYHHTRCVMRLYLIVFHLNSIGIKSTLTFKHGVSTKYMDLKVRQ